MHGVIRSLGGAALRAPAIRRLAVASAAIRGRGLVLVFHRIARDGESPDGIVPTVPREIFRRQLEELLEVGDIVPLPNVLEEIRPHARPRFALTFDDDYSSHHDVALPILRERDLSATFFLGGRSLHALGPLWFEILDDLVRSAGAVEVGHRLGIGSRDIQDLAETCEDDRHLQLRIESEGASVGGHLTAEEIAALAESGMTIGFHTLHHRSLTRLSDDEVDAALNDGRSALEDVVGQRLRLFAYPHGKADARTASRVRRAGFVAAWTGRPHAVAPRDDRYHLGRWEAGPIQGAGFVRRVAWRLNRSSGG
jgi:peptidoglycan/xylan/chitin deacetylase (PgdA/CDA1 family)